jgi:hypothetical protein
MNRLALVCLIPLLASPLAAKEPAAKEQLERLAFLAGSWEGSVGGGIFRAHYAGPTSGVVLGASELVVKGEVVFHEFERFWVAGEEVVVQPYPGGKPALRFSLTTLTPGKAVFENAKNEFPKRIEYHLAATDRLVITTSNPGGKKQVFDLRRRGRAPLSVKAARWTDRRTARGHLATTTIPYPAALIERILVDAQRRRPDVEVDVVRRMVLKGGGGGVLLGCNLRTTRREGKTVVRPTPAFAPSLVGIKGVKAGKAQALFGFQLGGHTLKAVGGEQGNEYTVRVLVRVLDLEYELRLAVTQRLPTELKELTTIFDSTWDGPFLPTPTPTPAKATPKGD